MNHISLALSLLFIPFNSLADTSNTTIELSPVSCRAIEQDCNIVIVTASRKDGTVFMSMRIPANERYSSLLIKLLASKYDVSIQSEK